MVAAERISIGRYLGLSVLVAAGMLALPVLSRADPATSPGATAPSPPLTVTQPDRPDVVARREANRARILDARLDALHAGLRLSAAQEPLWSPVAEAIHAVQKAHGIRFRQQLEAVSNSIDGLEMQGDHMAKVGAAMGRLAYATRPLVASLSPDQKSRLPALLERMRPRKLMARAFDIPLDKNGSSAQTGAAGTTNTQPSAGSAPTGGKPPITMPPAPQAQTDPDEDD